MPQDLKEKPKTDSSSIFLASEEGRREELMEGSWEMRRSAIGAASDSLGEEWDIWQVPCHALAVAEECGIFTSLNVDTH